MSEYQETLDRLNEFVPEFNFSHLKEEDSVVIVSFFIEFLVKEINNKNHKVIDRSALFINKICKSNEPNSIALFDEIAIGVWDAKCYSNYFKDKLSPEAIKKFDEVITIWKVGNSIEQKR